MRARDALLPGTDSFRSRNSSLSLPAMFELAAAGPAAARAALDRARRLAAERQAPWVDPFLGFAAGGIAFAAGDWDDAVAELDAALERAEETGTGWISLPVGFRAYIDAHRGRTGPARDRLESFRHRGLPLQFGHDRPGWAELAVLEAEGEIRRGGHAGPDAVVRRPGPSRPLGRRPGPRRDPGRPGRDGPPPGRPDRRGRAGAVPARGVAPGARHARCRSRRDRGSGRQLAGTGRLAAEAFAREELACAAAAAGDRDRAAAALDAALAGYQRIGAVPDRDRALARTRALGIRRGSREPHRDADLRLGQP